MCGICGNLNFTRQHKIDTVALKKMTLAIRHRGPDELGLFKDTHIGLGHARLSILDLKGGQQPIHNEDKTIWVTFNGEIFNYIELRQDLLNKGHKFYTKSDTEVLIHLYEEFGTEFLNQLNGQFSFAIWDLRNKRLMLARDRVGIRPLYYTITQDGSFLFASEIKALFTDPRVIREIDPKGLDQLFTFWATVPPQTCFKGINELAAGCYMIVQNETITTKRYWQVDFTPDTTTQSEDDYADQLLELLKDSINLRLRADVPVAAYLSGGLDSSLITALVKKHFKNRLETFSVSFTDKAFDEGSYQQEMAKYLGTNHKSISCSYADIGRIMPQVVWHAEKPLIRTAPAPLYMLAKLVHKNRIKVVLTGEGADEVLGGYDLFREAKIRRFWAQNPGSKMRPLLMRQLYSYIPNWPKTTSAFLDAFYRTHLKATESLFYSHLPRWDITNRIKNLYSQEMKDQLNGYDPIAALEESLPQNCRSWDGLAKAQCLEMATLLSGNLLSSQGDRMMMAHAVEGRFPYLDYRVIEFCAKLPAQLKLKVLDEKYLLKKIAKSYLPESITSRKKQAYRSPDSASFSGGKYFKELLHSENPYFDKQAVELLVKKLINVDPNTVSARDNMAIVAVITTLLLDKQFIGARHEDLHALHTS